MLCLALACSACGQGEKYYIRTESGTNQGPYDELWSWSEGLALVRLGDHFGYIDLQGGLRIPAVYEGGASFHQGLAPVIFKKRLGYINTLGQWVIRGDYSECHPFKQGLARVRQGRYFGFINPRGLFVVEPIYLYAEDFSEGLAGVIFYDQDSKTTRYGYINTRGRMAFVLDNPAEGIGLGPVTRLGPFQEGKALIYTANGSICVDQAGNTLFHSKIQEISAFSQGMAVFRTNQLCGYLDAQGRIVISPQYLEAQPFHQDLARVQTTNGTYGLIDLTGKDVIRPVLQELYGFSEDLALVVFRGQAGYINRQGQVVIKPHFEAGGRFSQGLAAVQTNQQWGYIDSSGQWVIPPQFEAAGAFQSGRAPARQGKKWGVIDLQGQWVISPRFSSLVMDQNVIVTTENK